MNLKLKSNITFQLFDPVNIKILKNLSDMDEGYYDYPDEDLPANTIMQLEKNPGGFYVLYGGRVYLGSDNSMNFVEGIDFIFV